MPLWIRSVFLHYLPAALLMRRPRKTRLRWMMEMPGMGAPPHAAAPHDLPKHIGYVFIRTIGSIIGYSLGNLIQQTNCTVITNQ